MSRRSLHLAQILWPAFLIAGVLEMVVFALIDPAGLVIGNWAPEPRTVYSLTFFVFWGLVATASAITHAMMRQPRDVTLSRRAARKQARRAMVVQHQP
jgi:hypothetical protein